MILNNNVTVGLTPTKLSVRESDSHAGYSLAVKVPSDGHTIFVGPAGVTTSNGFPVNAGETLYLDLDFEERLYGISATTPQAVYCIARGA